MNHEHIDDLYRAYRPVGGIMTADQIASLRRALSEPAISTVARWIVDRQVVSFTWQSQWLLPVFQFDMTVVAPSPRVNAVLAELRPTHDNWELAQWFAEPNDWLGSATPAGCCILNPRRFWTRPEPIASYSSDEARLSKGSPA